MLIEIKEDKDKEEDYKNKYFMIGLGFECWMEEMCVIVKILIVLVVIFFVYFVDWKSVVLNVVVIDNGFI